MVTKIELLKKALHPEKQINIIEQCEIVADALSDTGDYVENLEGLAIFLEISESKVYQMNYIHHNMIPELKKHFRASEYQCHTTYDRSKLPPLAQLEMAQGFDTLSQTIIEKEKD